MRKFQKSDFHTPNDWEKNETSMLGVNHSVYFIITRLYNLNKNNILSI